MHILRSTRTFLCAIFFFCMVATLTFLMMRSLSPTSAASFNPGNIMSDAVMSDYGSMTVDEIQAFLTEKNPCNNHNYALYQEQSSLYPGVTWHWEGGSDGHFVCLSEERFGDGVTIGSGQTAAEIIYQAAQDYQINPQVLIVLLEKEQGLITDTYPHSGQYRSATGYGCPDTAACDTKYYGFKNQVRNAAALFRHVLDNGYAPYPEQTSGVYIRFSPDASCGSSEVFIENRATSALYRYTPYQPNAAALAAGYGTGDVCSAYGNRNFYLYFTDWFGSTQGVTVDGSDLNLPDGTYHFSTLLNSQSTLEIAGSGTNSGDPVQVWDRTTSNSDEWLIERTASGTYTLTNVNANLRLALPDNQTSTGTQPQLRPADNTCGQQWRIRLSSDNHLIFESACTPNLVLEVTSGANGDTVRLASASNQNNQKWDLYTGRQIEDGLYVIISELNHSKVVDLSNAGTANNTNIQLWGYDSRTIAQKWTLTYNPGNDTYTVTHPLSGRAMDVSGGSMEPATNIQLWDSNQTCAQQWKLILDREGNYSFLSSCNLARSVDVAGGGDANGTNIQIWDTNNTDAQKWRFVTAPIVEDGTYTIISKLSSARAMDVSGGETAAGTSVQIWGDNGTGAQQWHIQYDWQARHYTITNPQSDKPLYLNGITAKFKDKIQIDHADGSCSQYWDIYRADDGSYTFLSSCDSGMALDVSDGSSAEGTKLWLWDDNHTNAQRWSLRKLS